MTAVLQDKKALITGATTGIGFASARAMIDEGAEVIITGQNEERVNAAVSDLGPKAFGVTAASQDAQTPARIAEAVADRFGSLDVLFANAGVCRLAPLGQIDANVLAQQMAINVTGPLMMVQALQPLLNRGASVFFTTSNLDRMGVPGLAVYSAAKAAIRSLVRTLAAELASGGVRVNAIAPGPIETTIMEKTGLSKTDLDTMKAEIRSMVPLGRFGKPEEIAGAAVFLASDASSFMLGEEITIDGGRCNL
jgi:NAD(P)-dependent dehydrogenase (short-subunit alcohol dehydrogenase family)